MSASVGIHQMQSYRVSFSAEDLGGSHVPSYILRVVDAEPTERTDIYLGLTLMSQQSLGLDLAPTR